VNRRAQTPAHRAVHPSEAHLAEAQGAADIGLKGIGGVRVEGHAGAVWGLLPLDARLQRDHPLHRHLATLEVAAVRGGQRGGGLPRHAVLEVHHGPVVQTDGAQELVVVPNLRWGVGRGAGRDVEGVGLMVQGFKG